MPAAGLAEHPHPLCRRAELSGGRPGEPCWGGAAASGQGSSSGCEPGWRGSPKNPPSPCEEVTQRQPPPPTPAAPTRLTLALPPAAARERWGGCPGSPPPLSVVIRCYPCAVIPLPLSASQRRRQPRPPRHRRWLLQHSRLRAGARLALLSCPQEAFGVCCHA